MDGDLGGMLRQMMENPQFGNMIQAVKAQMGEGDGMLGRKRGITISTRCKNNRKFYLVIICAKLNK